jgi:hypothetical protein
MAVRFRLIALAKRRRRFAHACPGPVVCGTSNGPSGRWLPLMLTIVIGLANHPWFLTRTDCDFDGLFQVSSLDRLDQISVG